MFLAESTSYGPFADVVAVAGALVASVAAIGLGWRKRSRWEPSEEDIANGPQRVGSLLAIVAIGLIYALIARPENVAILGILAGILALFCLFALLVYGFVVAVYTHAIPNREASPPQTKNVIGGFYLTREAWVLRRNKGLTIDELFAELHYNVNRVWPRPSRALSKAVFVVCYLALTVCGTVALAATAFAVQARQQEGSRTSEEELVEKLQDQIVGKQSDYHSMFLYPQTAYEQVAAQLEPAATSLAQQMLAISDARLRDTYQIQKYSYATLALYMAAAAAPKGSREQIQSSGKAVSCADTALAHLQALSDAARTGNQKLVEKHQWMENDKAVYRTKYWRAVALAINAAAHGEFTAQQVRTALSEIPTSYRNQYPPEANPYLKWALAEGQSLIAPIAN
jgi:hypothetical protein